jgi:hypothetical protein
MINDSLSFAQQGLATFVSIRIKELCSPYALERVVDVVDLPEDEDGAGEREDGQRGGLETEQRPHYFT